jgi:L-alanine-DL-glutamate epimerase-like enolase superfamily enzyme
LKIAGAHLFPICLPFARGFANAQGVVTERRGTLVRFVSDTGEVGWGEASPYPGFGLESLEASRAALASAAGVLLGSDVVIGDELTARVAELTKSSTCARAAIETALLDLWARTRQQPLFEFLTPERVQPRPRIECNALLTGDELDSLESAARFEIAKGTRTFKLKVGARDLDRDLARVAKLRDVVGPGAKIRLDANQGYDPGYAETGNANPSHENGGVARTRVPENCVDALFALESFARYRIEYLEQPLAAAALDAMGMLREKSPILLAADESATCEEDALRVIDAAAADVIVIKPSALGGPVASLRVARAARKAGLAVVVTSLLDSAVGVAAARQVAVAIASEGALPACGLATDGLFARDVASLEAPVRGWLASTQSPGLGIEMDESRVRKCLAGNVLDLSA